MIFSDYERMPGEDGAYHRILQMIWKRMADKMVTDGGAAYGVRGLRIQVRLDLK